MPRTLRYVIPLDRHAAILATDPPGARMRAWGDFINEVYAETGAGPGDTIVFYDANERQVGTACSGWDE